MIVKHYTIIRPCKVFVVNFDDELLKTKEEMKRICLATNGVGLAASQIGLDKRLFIFNRETNSDPEKKEGDDNWVLVCNPKVKPIKSAGFSTSIEACLSVPNESYSIRRWAEIEATWQDEKTGEERTEILTGQDARVFQHEYDHLVARSIVDRSKGQYRSTRFEKKKKKVRRRR